MDKKLIRLTEQDLHNIIMESVSRVINEADEWITDYIKDVRRGVYDFEILNDLDGFIANFRAMYSNELPNYLESKVQKIMRRYEILKEKYPNGMTEKDRDEAAIKANNRKQTELANIFIWKIKSGEKDVELAYRPEKVIDYVVKKFPNNQSVMDCVQKRIRIIQKRQENGEVIRRFR